MPYTNNKGADQPVHPRSLISAFVLRCIDSIKSLVTIFVIEGASATRYLNPLLGKIELSIMSCRKHVSASDYLPFTIEISQEMNLKVFSKILQRS